MWGGGGDERGGREWVGVGRGGKTVGEREGRGEGSGAGREGGGGRGEEGGKILQREEGGGGEGERGEGG